METFDFMQQNKRHPNKKMIEAKHCLLYNVYCIKSADTLHYFGGPKTLRGKSK